MKIIIFTDTAESLQLQSKNTMKIEKSYFGLYYKTVEFFSAFSDLPLSGN